MQFVDDRGVPYVQYSAEQISQFLRDVIQKMTSNDQEIWSLRNYSHDDQENPALELNSDQIQLQIENLQNENALLLRQQRYWNQAMAAIESEQNRQQQYDKILSILNAKKSKLGYQIAEKQYELSKLTNNMQKIDQQLQELKDNADYHIKFNDDYNQELTRRHQHEFYQQHDPNTHEFDLSSEYVFFV